MPKRQRLLFILTYIPSVVRSMDSGSMLHSMGSSKHGLLNGLWKYIQLKGQCKPSSVGDWKNVFSSKDVESVFSTTIDWKVYSAQQLIEECIQLGNWLKSVFSSAIVWKVYSARQLIEMPKEWLSLQSCVLLIKTKWRYIQLKGTGESIKYLGSMAVKIEGAFESGSGQRAEVDPAWIGQLKKWLRPKERSCSSLKGTIEKWLRPKDRSCSSLKGIIEKWLRPKGRSWFGSK